jgi:serine/threonine protein kinase
VGSQCGPDLESLIGRFEELWLQGEKPSINAFLAAAGEERARLLLELVHAELELRLKVGEPVRVEEYLGRFPELAQQPEAQWGLIAAEYRQRARREPNLSVEEYKARFPEWSESLARLEADSPKAATPHPRAEGSAATAPGPTSSAEVGYFTKQSVIPGYEILGELGRGAMGVVYKARHLALNRTVALKMILAGQHAGPQELARFQTEARAAAQIQHANVVQIFEVGQHESLPFLALEYCPGGNLAAHLLGTPLQPREAAQVVEQVARGVHAIHQQHIIHRDLKPANVLLASDGTVKVTDFGLAKKLDEPGLTQSGAVVGTPNYMSPEQLKGKSREIGPAADVYALGAILYECLTGRPPFQAPSLWETLEQVRSQEPVSPRQLRTTIPGELESICLTCLQKDPIRRYQSAEELAADLARWLCGETLQGRRRKDSIRAGYDSSHPLLGTGSALRSGIISLILGALGLLFALIPSLAAISTPICGIGLMLGVVGAALAVKRKKNYPFPVAGTLLSGAGLVFALCWDLGNQGALPELNPQSSGEKKEKKPSFLGMEKRPTFLGVWIDEYSKDSPIPVNPWAEQDRTALKQLPWKHINAFTSQERRLLMQQFEELQATENPVIVLISANAVTRPDGSVHLLAANSRVDDVSTWVPLTEVLSRLRGCRSKHKLLILDLKYFAAPRQGLIADAVSVCVKPILEHWAREDPHLHILWACTPAGHSLSAEELGHSAFAFYLVEGLKGRADGYAAEGKLGDRDGRVSVTELALFVQARVDRSSRLTHDTRLIPQYLGKGADFGLLAVPEQPPAASAPPAAAVYPRWLRAAWQTRDDWFKAPWPRVPPGLLRELEDALLRAENHLRAGVDPARVENAAKMILQRLRWQRDRRREEVLPQRPPSLAREVARGKQPPDLLAGGVLAKYRGLLALNAKLAATPKPDGKDRERLRSELDVLLKSFAGKPFELAWMVFDELEQGRELPSQRSLGFAAQLLSAGPPKPGYEEIAFVQRLAEWKVEAKGWDSRLVRLTLQLARKAAQASALADDPRLLPWVKERLKTAQASRQTAERLLFDPGEKTAEEVHAALNAALRANQEVYTYLRTLAGAFRARDDALVIVPGYAPLLEREPDGELFWSRAIENTLELGKELQIPPATSTEETFRKIGNLTATLEDALKFILKAPALIRARHLIGISKKAGPDDRLKMNALLQIPWLEAGERVELWTAERQLANRLTQLVLQMDAQDDTAGWQTPAPRPVDAATARAAQKQALLRARVSLGLLRLGGATDLQALNDALERAREAPDDAEAWRALSERLRQAWSALKASAPAANGKRTP